VWGEEPLVLTSPSAGMICPAPTSLGVLPLSHSAWYFGVFSQHKGHHHEIDPGLKQGSDSKCSLGTSIADVYSHTKADLGLFFLLFQRSHSNPAPFPDALTLWIILLIPSQNQ
jgi:hypothetical protein